MKFISRILRKLILKLFAKLYKKIDSNLLLSGKNLSNLNSKKVEIKDFSEVEFSVYSQWGEDGIINWLLDKLEDLPETFIEFGVENYIESNTRYLLHTRNWSGLVIDGDKSNIEDIKKSSAYWKYDLSAVEAFITKKNINTILQDNNFKDEVGLLSIDIDGNDYWIWNEISCIKPILVVAEYNAVFGDKHFLTVPYDPDFVRGKKHYSNLFFGASINALISLAKEKGYELIGTNTNGVNAFFVREDRFELIKKYIHQVSIYPSKFRESRDRNGNLNYLNGPERLKEIKDCELVDVKSKSHKKIKISELNNIYSNNWLKGYKSVI